MKRAEKFKASAPVGVGLRAKHYAHILNHVPRSIGWFEIITENFLGTGGRPLWVLEQIRSHYPIAFHGVSLSIGSTPPLREDYLRRWKDLIERIDPFMVSDHLCWTGMGGHNTHDLLPLPYHQASLARVIENVDHVQNFLGRRLYLENPSSYVAFKSSTMSEWEFLAELAKRSGCGLLVDVNNIYVSSKNFAFDPHAYLFSLPPEAVGQFHIAGHLVREDCIIDTHQGPTPEVVWDMYRLATQRFGAQVPALIEWDTDIPEFAELERECARANKVRQASSLVESSC
jgi:uncharacterized protein (UPF0276 family)